MNLGEIYVLVSYIIIGLISLALYFSIAYYSNKRKIKRKKRKEVKDMFGKQKAWVVTRKDGTEKIYFDEKEFVRATFETDYSHHKIEKRSKKEEMKKEVKKEVKEEVAEEKQEPANDKPNNEIYKEVLFEKCDKAKSIEDLKQILKKLVESCC